MQSVSAKNLRDINPDLLFSSEDDERRCYDFIREHFDEHQVIPTSAIVRENTGIRLPDLTKGKRRQPVSYYFERCKQRSLARAIEEPFTELADGLQSPRSKMGQINEAIEALYQAKSRHLSAGTGIETTTSLVEGVLKTIEERRYSGSSLRGITTGYGPVDEAMDGYNKDDLAVWVGRPGRAKSWLLLKQCHAAWTAGYKPLYVSMEMGGEQNMRRLIGIQSGINPTFLKRGRISTNAMPLLRNAVDELLRLRPMHMVTANFSRTVEQIATFVEEYEPDICYIDAGYLLSPKKKRFGSSGRRETISDVIEELKELGSNFGIPVVITVQFNRGAEQRRRGSNERRREGQSENFNPIAHLSLAEIGETDVIGQVASHVFGIEFPPYPLPQNLYRVFGFLKGREGEDGWWLTQFMQRQFSPVSLDLIDRSDPVYQQIMQGGGNARSRPTGQRSAAMALQG